MNLLDSLPALPVNAIAPRTGTGAPRQRPPFIRPVRIGRDASALAGIYQPSAPRPDTGVLICNPFGQEAIRAQRSLRVVAERLARQGVPSLRFDYFGTGDSPGEDGSGHLTRWRQDILLADVRLRQLCGCRTTIWMGLRLGATLALQAAELIRDLPRPRRIVLWEPVLDGNQYLRHLARMNEFWTRQTDVTHEALGFALTTRIRRHIAAIQADNLPLPAGCALDLLGTKALPGRNAFIGHCREHDAPLHDILLDSTVEWTSNTALDSQWVPDEAIAALLEICAQPDDIPTGKRVAQATPSRSTTAGHDASRPPRPRQAPDAPPERPDAPRSAASRTPGGAAATTATTTPPPFPRQKDGHADDSHVPASNAGQPPRTSGHAAPRSPDQDAAAEPSPREQTRARVEQPDSIPLG